MKHSIDDFDADVAFCVYLYPRSLAAPKGVLSDLGFVFSCVTILLTPHLLRGGHNFPVSPDTIGALSWGSMLDIA